MITISIIFILYVLPAILSLRAAAAVGLFRGSGWDVVYIIGIAVVPLYNIAFVWCVGKCLYEIATGQFYEQR